MRWLPRFVSTSLLVATLQPFDPGTTWAGEANPSFVNWETPHVHPLELTPDGTRLLAGQHADDRLEVFDLERRLAVTAALDPGRPRAGLGARAQRPRGVGRQPDLRQREHRRPRAGNVVATLRHRRRAGRRGLRGPPGARLRLVLADQHGAGVRPGRPRDGSDRASRSTARTPRAMAVSPDGETRSTSRSSTSGNALDHARRGIDAPGRCSRPTS